MRVTPEGLVIRIDQLRVSFDHPTRVTARHDLTVGAELASRPRTSPWSQRGRGLRLRRHRCRHHRVGLMTSVRTTQRLRHLQVGCEPRLGIRSWRAAPVRGASPTCSQERLVREMLTPST